MCSALLNGWLHTKANTAYSTHCMKDPVHEQGSQVSRPGCSAPVAEQRSTGAGPQYAAHCSEVAAYKSEHAS